MLVSNDFLDGQTLHSQEHSWPPACLKFVSRAPTELHALSKRCQRNAPWSTLQAFVRCQPVTSFRQETQHGARVFHHPRHDWIFCWYLHSRVELDVFSQSSRQTSDLFRGGFGLAIGLLMALKWCRFQNNLRNRFHLKLSTIRLEHHPSVSHFVCRSPFRQVTP